MSYSGWKLAIVTGQAETVTCLFYLHSRNSKICRRVWKKSNGISEYSVNLQEPKDYKAVVTLTKVQQHSCRKCQKEASPEYLQSQPKSPASAAFCSFMACLKKCGITYASDGTKGNTARGKKLQKLTTLKVIQKIHILNRKKF